MTDSISAFAVTEAGNNISSGLFPELLAPSQTTDNLRRLQAAIRRQWNQAQWFSFGTGDGPASFAFLASDRFRVINASVANEYHVNRRVRARGTITGTIVGSITAVVQTGGNTDVTCTFDSGSLNNEDLTIELGILSASDPSIPAAFAGGASFGAGSSFAGDVSIAGNLAITGDVSADEATFQTVNFTNGPFNFISSIRRLAGGGGIIVPALTKQIFVEVWGAGGGGTARGAPAAAGNGQNTSITTSPPGRTINVPGGAPGGSSPNGASAGQDQAITTGATTAGVFASFLDFPGLGAPGGVAAEEGVGGNAGHYVRAVINATQADIASFSIVGGSGGVGGSAASPADRGGAGGPASLLCTFWG